MNCRLERFPEKDTIDGVSMEFPQLELRWLCASRAQFLTLVVLRLQPERFLNPQYTRESHWIIGSFSLLLRFLRHLLKAPLSPDPTLEVPNTFLKEQCERDLASLRRWDYLQQVILQRCQYFPDKASMSVAKCSEIL